jgi:methionyl-tRNA formyltransferase
MRIVFMGTGEIALPAFRSLLGVPGWELVGLVTQPDKPVGRHQQELVAPRIKLEALAADIPVIQPERVKRRAPLAWLAALAPDVVVVMAYGQRLPPELLEMPRLACINLHASLLPRHRGASCIPAAILAGDPQSGITVMHMSHGMDEGDIILRSAIPLAATETGGSLHDRLAALAPLALTEALGLLGTGTATRTTQDPAAATHAPKLDRGVGELAWSEPAESLERRIRALDPWPGTFTTAPDSRGRPRRLKVFPATRVANGLADPGTILAITPDGIEVACGSGSLILTEVQPDGGRRMPATQAAHGARWSPGTRFGS